MAAKQGKALQLAQTLAQPSLKMQAYMERLLEKEIADLDRDDAVNARNREEHIKTAKMEIALKLYRFEHCDQNKKHKKPDGKSAIQGQMCVDMANRRRFVGVCTICNTEFHKPSREGEFAVPPGMMPDLSLVGGQMNL